MRSINRSNNQLIAQAIHPTKSANGTTTQTPEQSNMQSNQTTNQTINRSTNRTTIRPIGIGTTNQSIKRSKKRPSEHSNNQHIDQQTKRPM